MAAQRPVERLPARWTAVFHQDHRAFRESSPAATVAEQSLKHALAGSLRVGCGAIEFSPGETV